jgi:periplasmic protein TonB
MENNDRYLNSSMDDLVFDNRNKDYGAYALRKSYSKSILTGFGIGVLAFGLIAASDKVGELLKKNQQDEEVVLTTVTLSEPPPLNKDTPPPPPPPPPPPVERPTIKFMELVAKKNEEVQEEEPIVKAEEMKINVAASTETKGDVTAKVEPETPIVSDVPVVQEKPFTVVEQMPAFPGGDAALYAYLSKNIKYPEREQEDGIQGKVFVRFVVNENGSVSDAEIVRGVSPGLDKEARRVVLGLPQFTPGRQGGKAVKVYYNLPVTFKLQ